MASYERHLMENNLRHQREAFTYRKLQWIVEYVELFFKKSATSCSDNKWVLWSGCTKELNFKKCLYLLLCKNVNFWLLCVANAFEEMGLFWFCWSLLPEEFCIPICATSMFSLFSFALFLVTWLPNDYVKASLWCHT